MNEIKCPKCNEKFKIDEAGYADIVKQVRNAEFDAELRKQEEVMKSDKENAVKLAEANTKNAMQDELAKKDNELSQLKTRLSSLEGEKESAIKLAEEKTKNNLKDELSKKDSELLSLKSEKEQSELKIKAEKDKEIAELKIKLDSAETQLKTKISSLEDEKEAAVKLAEEKAKSSLKNELSKKDSELLSLKSEKEQAELILKAEKDNEITELKAKLESAETKKKLAVTEAVGEVEKEAEKLRLELAKKDSEQSSLKERYLAQIKDRDDTIERLKDMKAKLSTKMLGETLEEHCKNEFDRVRAMSFPNAVFKKDNDSSSGSKGDFIYREDDDNGNEIISIMFEMKNENDTTATKRKNEDFYKELDKDRREKKCEYAILVSLLEADSELYNNGIVDVSHEYPKMFVVRPQFFLPIIGLLRNAAQNSLTYKNELAIMKNHNIDITNFEKEVLEFKDGFAKTFTNAAKKYKEAIDSIDKSIAQLKKTKEALMTSEKHLISANNKAEDLTIKKLIRNNPTMTNLFAEQKVRTIGK